MPRTTINLSADLRIRQSLQMASALMGKSMASIIERMILTVAEERYKASEKILADLKDGTLEANKDLENFHKTQLKAYEPCHEMLVEEAEHFAQIRGE